MRNSPCIALLVFLLSTAFSIAAPELYRKNGAFAQVSTGLTITNAREKFGLFQSGDPDVTAKNTTRAGIAQEYLIALGVKLHDRIVLSINQNITPNITIREEARNADNDKRLGTNISTYSTLFNIEYAVYKNQKFRINLVGGPGFGINHMDVANELMVSKSQSLTEDHIVYQSKNKLNFIWNAGVSTQVQLSKSMVLDLRYFYTDKARALSSRGIAQKSATVTTSLGAIDNTGQKLLLKLRSHSFLIGVRFYI